MADTPFRLPVIRLYAFINFLSAKLAYIAFVEYLCQIITVSPVETSHFPSPLVYTEQIF